MQNKLERATGPSDSIEDDELDGLDVNWKAIDPEDESDSLKYLLEQLPEELKDQSKFLSMTSA